MSAVTSSTCKQPPSIPPTTTTTGETSTSVGPVRLPHGGFHELIKNVKRDASLGFYYGAATGACIFTTIFGAAVTNHSMEAGLRALGVTPKWSIGKWECELKQSRSTAACGTDSVLFASLACFGALTALGMLGGVITGVARTVLFRE